MRLIEIEPLPNGGHRNQSSDAEIYIEGCAVIPDDMDTPNFPFGDIEVEEIDGVMTVTKWTPREIPKVEKPEPEPTTQDDTDAMLVDHEYRITLLELGLTEI